MSLLSLCPTPSNLSSFGLEIHSMVLAPLRKLRMTVVASLAVLVSATATNPSFAQVGGVGGGFGQSVGGVVVDATGALRGATIDEKNELANVLRDLVAKPQGELAQAVKLRAISLKGMQAGLSAAIADHRDHGTPIPSEIEYLAGLQRIEYVFVDADQADIIIAGPAEAWELRDDGSVVGTVSGQPTLRLEDLMVALQTVETARVGGISCSIEPTDAGRAKLQQLLRGIRLQPGQNPTSLEPAMREAFGPQQVLLTGVPTDSRYARTLVAADFEMKRIAMELVASHVDGLPSYLEMSKNAAHAVAQNPRWWMACNYDSLQRSEDKLAWKISGQGVKTLTELDIISASGAAKASGNVDKVAQKWAELMTGKFSELSRQMPIFGELRNTIDMTVVATLIVQEHLAERAGLDLSLLAGKSDSIELASYPSPTTISPQCSFVRGRSGWTVTASGGVEINAFEVVGNQTTDDRVNEARSAAIVREDSTRWWWNG